MNHRIVLTILIILSVSTTSTAWARPGALTGAPCKTCHEGPPRDKKFIPEIAAKGMDKYKAEECKKCHEYKDGKIMKKADAATPADPAKNGESNAPVKKKARKAKAPK